MSKLLIFHNLDFTLFFAEKVSAYWAIMNTTVCFTLISALVIICSSIVTSEDEGDVQCPNGITYCPPRDACVCEDSIANFLNHPLSPRTPNTCYCIPRNQILSSSSSSGKRKEKPPHRPRPRPRPIRLGH